MTREEIIEAISDDKMMPFIQPEPLAQIVEFVIKNYRPPLPEDLDEATKEYAPDFSNDLTSKAAVEAVRDAFKAGAEWQANQGASYETVISADKTIPILPMKDVSEMGFDYGDKVRVIVIKEDK